MRAKKVPAKAYIFDWDDVLVKTRAKIHIYKDGKKIKSLTPAEFNTYKLQSGEVLDVSEFSDPRFIINARKFRLWPALENISNAKKMGRSSSDIFILTARSEKSQIPIHNFLEKNGIEIPLENVITIGFDDGREHDAAIAKEKVLRELKEEYADIMFFDDSEENIQLASKIGGIKTRLIDWNK